MYVFSTLPPYLTLYIHVFWKINATSFCLVYFAFNSSFFSVVKDQTVKKDIKNVGYGKLSPSLLVFVASFVRQVVFGHMALSWTH